MKESKQINRRRFLQTAAAATTFAIIPRHVLGGNGQPAANDKVNVAAVGVGWMGAVNLRNLESQNIVAICDVDTQYVAETLKKYPNAKIYKDYRQMLDKQKDIDAVLIATPDHTHAVITIAAMQAGKHVYCQKPLTHTIEEARRVARIAKETGVVTQTGTQGQSGEGFRRLCEWIWAGAIGDVEAVDAWSTLNFYPPGNAVWCTTHYDIPAEKPPVPEGLDWDLWLGPAPWRDYHPTYHPYRWRAWYDFGCGMMGDRGVHSFNPIISALKLKLPHTISATVSNVSEQTHPFTSIVKFHCAARQSMPPVELTWYEGIEVPRPFDLEDGRKLPVEGGILFKGKKGTIMCGYRGDSPRIIPETKMQEFKPPAPTLRRIKDTHEMEWINAIKEGRKANADFEQGALLTEFVLLGNLAKRTQSKLYYDAEKMKITNNEKADQLIRKTDRTGW